MPPFVCTPEAAAKIAVLGREPDRSKGAGKEHDSERPGHYIRMPALRQQKANTV